MGVATGPMTEEEVAFFDKTAKNAARLATDAKILTDYDRAGSAIMLAILAIEEMGKSLITFWGKKNKASKRPYPTHVEKQSATFALLAAKEICDGDRDEILKVMLEKSGDFKELGHFPNQLVWARAGFFDDVRMAVTYSDAEPKIDPDELDFVNKENATELLEWLRIAIEAIYDVRAMNLAATFYENDLGRL